MPRKIPPRKSLAPMPQPSTVPLSGSALTDEQVNRWAILISEGRDAFPENLALSDGERLLIDVKERLRGRLVRLIARAIASQFYRQTKT